MSPRLLASAALSLCLVACTPPPPSNSSRPEPRESSARRNSERGRERAEDRRPSPTTANQGFDFYLLNLSWEPEFCATHPGRDACLQHRGFVLHGLWPQNTDGTYPEHCGDAPGPHDPAQFQDLYPDAGLLHHEWQAHGSCSGLTPDQFFETARRASREIRIPPQLSTLDHQTAMTPDEILTLFTDANPGLSRQSLVLSCGNNYLTAVEVCLGKDLHPIVCRQVRSCRANSVRIPPPNPS